PWDDRDRPAEVEQFRDVPEEDDEEQSKEHREAADGEIRERREAHELRRGRHGRTTKAPVLQSRGARIRSTHKPEASTVFGGCRRIRRRGRSSRGGFADEQDPGGGDPDETEGEDGEGEGADGVREGTPEDRSDDQARPEDDRVDPERRPGHGPFDDVAEIGEGRGREGPGTRREDGDQGPL